MSDTKFTPEFIAQQKRVTAGDQPAMLGTYKNYPAALEEIERLQAKGQEAVQSVSGLREIIQAKSATIEELNRIAEQAREDAGRLANFIKHAQQLGLFRGSSLISAQALDVLDKHQQTTWE
jgi:pyruvate-formate lyase